MTSRNLAYAALAVCLYGQASDALAQDRAHESTEALQKAVDRNPSRPRRMNNSAQYAGDMHSADDWQRQFLTAGGHLEGVPPK